MTSLSLLLAPLTLFMFVSSITPGPNNLMLLSSGVRFGFARTVPHLLGITAGMVLLLLVANAGVGALLLASPWTGKLLTLLCCGYLLYLAVGLLRAAEAPVGGEAAQAQARPMRAWEAVLFQFVNPKAWAIAVTACTIAASLPLSPVARMAVMLLITVTVNLPCVSAWALFGRSLRNYLHAARVRQAFNIAMAALVVGTALWMAAPLVKSAGAQNADPARDPVLLLGR